jgi:hypothetical protein
MLSVEIYIKKKCVFGRLSYDYNGKYLLEGSLRYDEDSVFPKSQKGLLSCCIHRMGCFKRRLLE